MELNEKIADSLYVILLFILLYKIIRYDSHFLHEVRMKAVYWQLVLLNCFFFVSAYYFF